MDKRRILIIIGRACARWRRSQGKTQRDVAEWAGCTIQNVSEFERGHCGAAAVMAWYIWHGMPGHLIKEEA